MPANAVRSIAIGCGGYVPARCMHNDELSSLVDTSDEWIWQRTGIRQRYIAADGELTSDLATNAAVIALEQAGIVADDIDLLIVATCTPDETFPSTATTVQTKLGMTRGAAFDIHAVCSGFVYALSIADSMLKNGMGTTAMVVGAETLSRILDWTDRGSCVLFGDGAGAIVLRAEPGLDSTDERGVIASTLSSDGRLHDLLYTDGGPSSTRTTGLIRMQGKEVYRHAVTKLTTVVADVLEVADLKPSDIDWVIPHQANARIIDSVAQKLGVGADRLVVTVDKHANTSSASIPLALSVAVADGRVKPGDLLLFEALGGGMTWGANLLRW
jgi:3-oxoacyl-[acyl-carrier-protein] synthase-3